MLSIIIPVYNGEKTIERCINSILKNIDKNTETEIVIVNDGSTDKTEEVLQELKKKNSCIKIYSQANQGVSGARNLGIEKSLGNYIMFVDADDMLKDKIPYPSREDDWDLAVISGNCQRTECIVIKEKYEFIKGILGIKNEKFNNLNLNRPVQKIYKRNILKKYEIAFDKEVFHGEDMLFNLKYFTRCKKVKFIRKEIYKRIITEGSLTRKYSPKLIDNDINFYKRLYSLQLENDYPRLEYYYKIMIFNGLCGILNRYLLHKNNNKTLKEKKDLLNKLLKKEPFIRIFEVKYRDVHKKQKIVLFLLKNKLVYLLLLINYIIK